MEKIIYLAGGCFWGLEHLMRTLKGVIDATSGYANGTITDGESVTYQKVCTGETGFHETVKVVYDPEIISLDAIIMAYFRVIDPTITNRQGEDVGTQYQTGIYYIDEDSHQTINRIVDIEKERYDKFCVEIGPLINFYPAEEYHQDYLTKNPNGYCHIPAKEIAEFKDNLIDPGKYKRPSESEIFKKIGQEAYLIIHQSLREKDHANAYWDCFEQGIYVDAVTGEPLFSSLDKYKSSCGWPAFSKPIEAPTIVELKDLNHGIETIEVRSRAGNTHLGHLYENDEESPNGLHYCINSAALKFIPYEEMDKKGYGYLKNIFKTKRTN